MVGRVEAVFRYPVKSMQGSAVDALEIGPIGAPDDRGWAVVDQAAGRVLSAKRFPLLLQATATVERAGTVVVHLPDGSEHEAGDPATDAAVSAWLDLAVVLARPDPAAPLAFDMSTVPTDDDADTFSWTGPAGTWQDLAHVHLLTTASLASAAALDPAIDWDVRRFRPTALLALHGDDPWPEDAWVGRRVRTGGTVVEGIIKTMRCAMPTRAQPGLPADKAVSRLLTAHHGNDLGLYANVAQPGRLATGDEVALATA